MLTPLTWKEFRELLPLVALALVLEVLAFLGMQRIWYMNFYVEENGIPFVDSSLSTRFLYVGGIAAVAIGFWQTLWESGRGTFQFLLHRPVDRRAIFCVKWAIGILLTLTIPGVPLLLYCLWAALPGMHASPFFWSMTVPAWLMCFTLPLLYLGAFLSGLRPGRWWGSRVFPLAAAFGVVMVLTEVANWPILCLLLTLLLEACFLLTIQYVAATRDYS